jgi:peptidoglycan glycosyltransferase
MKNDPKKPIYNVVYIFIGLFALAMGYFAYFIVFRSNDIINSTYNKRQYVLAERVIRGEIRSADGETLAKTMVEEDGSEIREYPYGDLFAHVVGRSTMGRSGLEESENIRLLTSNINPIEQMYYDLTGVKSPGDHIITTLNTQLQQTAYEALGNYRGAVVVMEPSTGKILAMVSKPSYDPNTIDEDWEKLVEDEEEESPLLNRAAQGLYPPGSTFKILTALAYMRQNPSYESYEYDCDGSIEENGMVIHDYSRKGHGKIDLQLSLAKSCNTSFASIGRSLDLDQFHALTEDFLFNKYLPVTMASGKSSFPLQKANSSKKEAMQTAIGQGRTLITPLHNAMLVSTIANGGAMMRPYVVDRVENEDGGKVKTFTPQLYSKPMTAMEADYIAEMMRKVVTDGSATKLKDMEVEVAGKTGSAEHGKEKAHSWFIGYAPFDNPEIAVSIVVESVGTGSEYAVPIARKIFDAYFN